jgi:hypothetical protein
LQGIADKSDRPPCRARAEAEAEELRAARLKQLEEVVAKLLVTACCLPHFVHLWQLKPENQSW